MVNCLLTLEVHGSASGESMKYMVIQFAFGNYQSIQHQPFFLIILQRSLTRNRGGGIGAAESLQKHLIAHTRAPIDAYQLYAGKLTLAAFMSMLMETLSYFLCPPSVHLLFC